MSLLDELVVERRLGGASGSAIFATVPPSARGPEFVPVVTEMKA